MSIYDFKQKIKNISRYIPDSPRITATLVSGDYRIKITEKNLESIIVLSEYMGNKLDEIYVDPEYYNPKYCNINNIDPELVKSIDAADPLRYFTGKLLLTIDFYKVFTSIYEDDFDDILDNISLGGLNVIKMLFMNNDIITPLNDNYIKLMYKVINNEDLEDFILTPSKKLRFTPSELKKILSFEKYKIINIHSFSNNIFLGESDVDTLIEYINILLDNTYTSIDRKYTIHIGDDTMHLGYFILMMDIDTNIKNTTLSNYVELIKRYENMGGNLDFLIHDDITKKVIDDRLLLLN